MRIMERNRLTLAKVEYLVGIESFQGGPFPTLPSCTIEVLHWSACASWWDLPSHCANHIVRGALMFWVLTPSTNEEKGNPPPLGAKN